MSQSDPDVVVEFEGQPAGLVELAAARPGDVTVLTTKGFAAFEYTTQALVILAPAVVIQLGAIIRTHMETSRSVRIKVDGVEIEGMEADNAVETLEQLRNDRRDQPDSH
ncbi:MAG: hypothetical protein WDZ46_02065 [Solirubrobacterales bacterium]